MEFVKVGKNQVKRLSEVAAAAFYNYPMMTHYFPDPKKRMHRLTWYMEKTLNCAVCYGSVYATPDFSGVLFLLPPGHTRLTNAEFIRNGFLLCPLVMGFSNYLKSNECEKFVADTHDKLLDGRDHYYLWGLVADPSRQRKGVGSALMRLCLEKADAEHLPVYLETHDEKNIAYYNRFGFELIHRDTIPKHGLDIWCMLREPVK